MDTSTVQVSGTGSATTSANSSTCCSADCPVVVQSGLADAVTGLACSGHGSCLTGAGVCVCFAGYGGDACSACNGQYAPVADSAGRVVRCVLLAGERSTCVNGVRDGLEQGVDCGGVCPSCNSSSASGLGPSKTSLTAAGQVVVTTAAAAGALLAITLVVMEVRRRRRSKVITQRGSVRHSGCSIQPSAVCPVTDSSACPSQNDGRTNMSMDTRVAKILGRDDVAANGGRNGVGSRSRAAGISASSSCDHGPGVRGGAGHGGDSDRPGIQASKCLQGSGGASAGGIFEVAPGSQAPAAPWKAIVAPGHGATSGFGGTSAPGSTGTVVHPRP